MDQIRSKLNDTLKLSLVLNGLTNIKFIINTCVEVSYIY